MNEDESTLTNQTQFSYEEPYRESPPSPSAVDSVSVKNPPSKLVKVLAIGGAVFLMLLVALVLLAKRPQVTQQSPFQQPVVATPIPPAANPLLERVERLETELQAADPVKQTILFPPVQMDLRLDPKTR